MRGGAFKDQRLRPGILWLLPAGVLWLLTACAAPVVEVGPNPARLTVVVKAQVSSQGLNSALAGPIPFAGLGWWYGASYDGPYWNLWARLIDDKGKVWALPDAGRNPLLSGMRVEAAYRFLAPPGRRKLRLELTASIDRNWVERIERYQMVRTADGERPYLVYDSVPRTSRVTLTTVVRELEVELKPGQELTLRPFDGPTPAPPAAE